MNSETIYKIYFSQRNVKQSHFALAILYDILNTLQLTFDESQVSALRAQLQGKDAAILDLMGNFDGRTDRRTDNAIS